MFKCVYSVIIIIYRLTLMCSSIMQLVKHFKANEYEICYNINRPHYLNDYNVQMYDETIRSKALEQLQL